MYLFGGIVFWRKAAVDSGKDFAKVGITRNVCVPISKIFLVQSRGLSRAFGTLVTVMEQHWYQKCKTASM